MIYMRFWHIFTILMADIIFVFITPVCSNTSEFWSMVYFFNKGNRRHSIPWVTHLPRNRGCTLLLMGDNMLVWQSDRLWLSLDFLAAGDVKSKKFRHYLGMNATSCCWSYIDFYTLITYNYILTETCNTDTATGAEFISSHRKCS